MVGAAGTGALTAGRLYAFPHRLWESKKWTSMVLNITTAAVTASKKGRMGIYKSRAGKPHELVIDTGEFAIDAIAEVTATINQYLPAGQYWTTLIVDEACTVTTTASASVPKNQGQVSATGGGGTIRITRTYGALPATFPAIASTDWQDIANPAIWLKI
jgi:hypothetical protein